MASFEETVLVRTPRLFVRCKELGMPTQLADISGHDHHLDVVSGSLIFGQPSGVETDPEARSVYIPGGFALNIGQIAAPPSDLLFTGNFTIACFARQEFSFGSQYLFARGGNANSNTQGIHFNTAGSDTRTLAGVIVTTDGMDNTAHTVVGTTAHLLDVHNFHVFVRNGATLRLYTNAALVGENNSASTDPLLIGGSNKLAFGAAGNNLAPLKGWGAELIICDFAWTAADVTEVYEAAVNRVQLCGYSNVISSAVLYSDAEPDPISFPFRHNWVDNLVERISFGTGISTALKGYEQANAYRIKPRRVIELTQVLRDDRERRSLRAKLNAYQHQKWFVPILEDRERLTTPIAAATNVFALDTRYRDYEIGGYLGLRQLDNSGHITHSEELQIVGLSDPEITTATSTANDYTTPELYPVRRATLQPSQSLRGHTDSVEELTIQARLIAQDEKTVPHRITPWTPNLAYKSHEVFNPQTWQSNDWSERREYTVTRETTEVDFDAGPFEINSDAIAASETLTYRMVLEGKDKHAALLGWLYARAGALSYVWVATMQRDFEIVTSGLSTVTVAGHNYFENFAASEFRRDLAFVYHDNSVALRRIQGVAVSGANEVLTLTGGFTPTLTNLRSLSYLLFCRLDGDEIEIARITDNKARFSWRFRELLSSPD